MMKRVFALVASLWLLAVATEAQDYYKGGGAGSGAGTGTANTFTELNKFTNGLESYENNHADNANGVILGFNAGRLDASDSVNIGYEAGGGGSSSAVPTGSGAVRVGRHAGYSAQGNNGVYIGHASGQYVTGSGDAAVSIGYLATRNGAQFSPFHTFSSVAIGTESFGAGNSLQTATAVGALTGRACTAGVGAVLLGYAAGETATSCTESILIGSTAGRTLNRARTLVIDSDATLAPGGTGAFMYGELDNRTLQLNAGTGFRYRMESVTTTKTPALIESGEFYYTGDTDGQTFTLLDNPTILGTMWNFVVTSTQASNSMSIAPPSGETLRDGVSTCSTFTSTTIGSTATIMVTATGSGGHFTVVNKLGTWVCTP